MLTFTVAQCPVIPQPQQSAKQAGSFVISNYTSLIVADETLLTAAGYLQQELLKQQHLAVSRQATATQSIIRWQLGKTKQLPAEGYSISMNSKEVVVSANDEKGAFNAAVTLLQLISNTKKQNNILSVDCWNITDAPMYSWRGLMLDESRHFFGKEKVKSILDWMAFYKLNRFHWHLTDEPGWRLEIKKYPLLTLIGGIGTYSNAFTTAQFYTQDDVREIVRYATERQIVVIPEIDMPGHATAANKAYPQYSGGGSDKHPDFTFHPAKEETYSYLTTILRETNALFPSAMLHLGGDEVSFGNEKWSADPLVKALMQKQNLATVHKVEQYFMQRMADSVFSMNAKVLAWDEVAESGLPIDKTILFWWRHDQPQQLQKALNKGYDVVLCPRLPLYFDFVQDSAHTTGRKWGNKQFNPLQNVYDFSVTNLSAVTSSNSKQILGIQANVWTETMSTTQRLDYMLFPRIAALAEAAWTSKKDYPAFKATLVKQIELYKHAGINFYQPF
jgi:hexosaminidase